MGEMVVIFVIIDSDDSHLDILIRWKHPFSVLLMRYPAYLRLPLHQALRNEEKILKMKVVKKVNNEE